MKIAVLFDGAGLARLGLEQAGHKCIGFELDPTKHYLSKMVGSGNCVLADVREINLSSFDAVWASPPCQLRSSARTQGLPTSNYTDDLLEWSLNLSHSVLWVENVIVQEKGLNKWGTSYNAAQFLKEPLQNRNRIIGGRYNKPQIFRKYKKYYKDLDLCPCITATEYKGCATDKRRASRFYERRLTLDECAFHQGFQIPNGWLTALEGFTPGKWRNNLYEAIGNGVPVYMAKAFGDVYNNCRQV